MRLEPPNGAEDFAFTFHGILARALTPLQHAKVSILALSTFATDYVCVKDAELDRAIEALHSAKPDIEAAKQSDGTHRLWIVDYES